jgi:hypothetical protein
MPDVLLVGVTGYSATYAAYGGKEVITVTESSDEEPEPELAGSGLTFIPAELIPRLYTCPECGEVYVSPNALGAHAKAHPPTVD